MKRIEHLRRRLEDVIARNDEADELTRVPRGELLMDETFKAQLVAEGETRVQELRARLERENLVADYMSSKICLLYTSPSPRDRQKSRMPSSA